MKKLTFILIILLMCLAVSPTFALYNDGSSNSVSLNPNTMDISETMSFSPSARQDSLSFFVKTDRDNYYDLALDIIGMGKTEVYIYNITDQISANYITDGAMRITLPAAVIPGRQYRQYNVSFTSAGTVENLSVSFEKIIPRYDRLVFESTIAFSEIRLEKTSDSIVSAAINNQPLAVTHNGYTGKLEFIDASTDYSNNPLIIYVPQTVINVKLNIKATLSLTNIGLETLNITTDKSVVSQTCKIDDIKVVNQSPDGHTKLNLLLPFKSAAVRSIDIESGSADVIIVADKVAHVNIIGNNIIHTVLAFYSLETLNFKAAFCTNVLLNISRPDNTFTVTGAQVLENSIPDTNPLRPVIITATQILNVKIALY